MLDFKIRDDLDIAITGGEAGTQDNNVTTLMTAFFTDARVGARRGYWLDTESSDLWIHDQARVSNLTAKKMTESAKGISSELVDTGLFERIDAVAEVDDGTIYLNVRCYNDGQLVVKRKFRV